MVLNSLSLILQAGQHCSAEYFHGNSEQRRALYLDLDIGQWNLAYHFGYNGRDLQ
jgi:hypothetical protein